MHVHNYNRSNKPYSDYHLFYLLLNYDNFSLQLHLVHWNTTDFRTFEDAVKSEGGLAVLGVLLAVSRPTHCSEGATQTS